MNAKLNEAGFLSRQQGIVKDVVSQPYAEADEVCFISWCQMTAAFMFFNIFGENVSQGGFCHQGQASEGSDFLLILPFGVINILDPREGWMLLLSWALASSIWTLSVQFLCAAFPEQDGQILVCVGFQDNGNRTHPGSSSGAYPMTYVLNALA